MQQPWTLSASVETHMTARQANTTQGCVGFVGSALSSTPVALGPDHVFESTALELSSLHRLAQTQWEAEGAGKMVFDVYMVPRDALLACRPKGILDARTAAKIVDFVELKEVESETGFNRFCDLTHLSEHLSPREVLRLAVRRQQFNPNDIRVKSAFFATDRVGLEIAGMYERLLNSSRIEVRVWSDLQEAANWLGVERKLIGELVCAISESWA
jgi:hypothetical protein